MKTSQKILITALGFVTALLIISMVILRDHIQTVFTNTALENKYQLIPVEKFDRLDFSSNWIVTIKHGEAYKLELAIDDSMAFKPIVRNIDGTLLFSMDTTQIKQNTGRIRARITTPLLKAIRLVNGTRIHLVNFQSDSLAIDIENGCVFTGRDNKFKHLSFKSSGYARIELTETPDF